MDRSRLAPAQGAYLPITAEEHSERTQLEALRELLREPREARRLRAIIDLTAEASPGTETPETPADWANLQEQLDHTTRRIQQLETYLNSRGWNISPA